MAAIQSHMELGGAHRSESFVERKHESVETFPANWYTSPEMFELERRAIFSRRWLMLTHSSRVKDPGDFVRYQISGFDIVLSRDRSGNVVAFHNVCRHRAYPVVEQDQGTAKIFSCRYHGWSYGLNGKLAKAPGYQDLSNFDKRQNGLFSIHTRVDANGLIWINLDAQTEPEVAWENKFGGVEKQDCFKHFDFDNHDFSHAWQTDVKYNWKKAAENRHCAVTHPDVPEVANLDTCDMTPNDEPIDHDESAPERQMEKSRHFASISCWPYALVTVS